MVVHTHLYACTQVALAVCFTYNVFLYNYTYGVMYNNSDRCRDLLEYLVKLATPRLE